MSSIKRIKKEVSDINREIRNKAASYIMAGLGLVAGLAWNDAIKDLIEYFFPLEKSGLSAKFIYAFIITFLAVLVSLYVIKILETKEKNEEEK